MFLYVYRHDVFSPCIWIACYLNVIQTFSLVGNILYKIAISSIAYTPRSHFCSAPMFFAITVISLTSGGT